MRFSLGSRWLGPLLAAGLFAGGSALPPEPRVRPEEPRVYDPSDRGLSKRARRRKYLRQEAREKSTRERLQRQAANQRSRWRRRPVDGAQATINRMTNWQRNQWARAGYPADRVEHYARLVRMTPDVVAAAGLLAFALLAPFATERRE